MLATARGSTTRRETWRAIAVAAAQLQALFLWQNGEEIDAALRNRRPAGEAELADVLIHVLNFAESVGIDLLDAVERKIQLNEKRYPIATARGTSWKHNRLAA